MRIRVVGSEESLGGTGKADTSNLEIAPDMFWSRGRWVSSLLRVPADTIIEFRLASVCHFDEDDHAPGLQKGYDRSRNRQTRAHTYSALFKFRTPGPQQVLKVKLPEQVAVRLHAWDPTFFHQAEPVEGLIVEVSPIQDFLVSKASPLDLMRQIPMPQPGKQHTFSFCRGKELDLRMGVNLYLPNKFDVTQATQWPLLVFLHSQHCRLDGDLNIHYDTFAPARLVLGDEKCPRSLREDFILLTPQNLSSRDRGDSCGDGLWLRRGLLQEGTTFDPEMEAVLRDLIDMVVEDLPIDRRRVLIAGTSMGGQGVLQLASRWPGYFAAGVVIAGHFEFEPLEELAIRLSQPELPLWFFHAINDATCPFHTMATLAALIGKQSWAEVKFTQYKDTWSGSSGHCADRVPFWSNQFSNEERGWQCYGDDLFEWLARQRGPGLRSATMTPFIRESAWEPARR